MSNSNIISLIIIVFLAAAALFIVLPVDHPTWLEEALSSGDTTRDLEEFKLGLDLRGGTQVLLEADILAGSEVDSDSMDTAKTIIDLRVNGLGVTESNVQRQGDNRIIVELPGVDNPDQAVDTLRSTGQLEFVDAAGQFLTQGMIINTSNRPEAATNALAAVETGAIEAGSIPYPGQIFETVMTGDILSGAIGAPDQFGGSEIRFELTGEGSDQFFEYTRDNVGQPLAIVLDGLVLSAPTINAAIRDSGVITGQFSQEEAESLAIQMRYGALPVPLTVVDFSTIGASLGQDSVESSLRAGIIGMIGVLVFMLLIYRLPGVLADVALVLYILFNLAVFKLVPVTLTLPGIAGFVLSIGMAVDANILIFERMKEELRVGRSLRLAVEAGFSRAWPAIRDGNLSTLISCAVLFWFGNTFGASVVKGFALTLGIGVVLSMFTAVFVTRTFMRTFLAAGSEKRSTARGLIGY